MEYAAYLQNRLGRPSLKYKSPMNVCFGTTPELSDLFEFGTKCWVHTATPLTNHFQPKAVTGLVIGISQESNAYRVLVNNKVIVARNVTFSHNPDVSNSLESNEPPLVAPTTNDSPLREETTIPNIDETTPEPTEDLLPIRPSKALSNTKLTNLFRPSGRALLANETHDFDNLPSLPPPAITIPKGQLGIRKANQSELNLYWARARHEEMTKQFNLGVFELVSPPSDANILRGHFIHTAKTDSNGCITKLKARLVADGCGQLYGVDYLETYAATPSPDIIRLLLTYAAHKNLEVHQVDVDSAYLHAPIDQPVYMYVPEGVEINRNKGEVLMLKRALYGLKQAGRQWALHLKSLLERFGWIQNELEPCLFYKPNLDQYLLIYVDDIVIMGPSVETITKDKQDIGSVLPIKDLGEIHDYLGMSVTRNRVNKTFKLRQIGTVDDIIQRATATFRKRSVPRSPYEPVVRKDTPLNAKQHEWYRSIVGLISHLARFTRPDVSNAVNKLAVKLHAPVEEDADYVHQLIGYLQGTRDMFLELRGQDINQIKVYSDSDWAGDRTDRKSTSGFICYYGSSPITWSSKKQKCTAPSTMAAEYISLSDASKEAILLKNRAEQLSRVEVPVTMLVDNMAAQAVANGNPGHATKGAKHLDLRYHIVREMVQDGKLTVTRVDTHDNIADIFTKPLPKDAFVKHRNALPVG